MSFAILLISGFIYTTNAFNVQAQAQNLLNLALGVNETGTVSCEGRLTFSWDPSDPSNLFVTCQEGSVLGATPSPSPSPAPSAIPDSGDDAYSGGLTGRYYNNRDFTELVSTRIDQTVNFTWGKGAPDASIQVDTFSVEWTGFIKVPQDGLYTFYTVSDDGVRLFVDDQIILENWTDHAATENSGTIYLSQGTYPIYMQFYENRGRATAKLLWASEGLGKQIIPSEYLIPEDGDTSGGTDSSSSPTSEPTPTATPNPGAVPQGGLGTGSGDGLEVGINVAALDELRTRAALGDFDRACTDEEHDRTVWHTLVNPEAGCHYDHHHGDDPHYVNDIFGEPGAWFGKPGQSISYPWQTFALPSTFTRAQALAEDGTGWAKENEAKHEGYYWIVRRDRPCENDGPCVTDFRVQFHGMFFSHGAAVRWHSASIEARVCNNPADASTCGIAREGGWFDFGILSNAPTNSTHSAANEASLSDYIITLGNENQFGSLDTQGLMDEIRHHPVLSAAQIQEGPSSRNAAGAAEWWSHGGLDSRFQLRVMDPIGNVTETSPGSGTLEMQFHCDMNDIECPWNQSLMSLELDYVYNLNSYHLGGQRGTVNMPLGTQYVDRFGGINTNCSDVSVDCIPTIFENVPLNIPNDGDPYWARFVDDGCRECQLVDHDITPSGRPSWISWFYRYAHGAHNH